MNKADLTDIVAAEVGISKAKALAAIDALLGGVKKSLKKKKRVQLVGFGSFDVKKRKARKGRNPQTGKEIKIPAKKVPVFIAGSELKDLVK